MILAVILAFGDAIWGGAVSEIYVALHVGWVSFAVCCFVSVLGMIIACRRRLRIWLDWRVHESCQADCWPPTTFRVNSMRGIMLVTQLMLFVLGTAVLLLAAVLLGDWWDPRLTMLTLLVGPVLLAICVLALPENVFLRITARVPEECWPELCGQTTVLSPLVFIPSRYSAR
jgi:hypothetical protein